MAVLNPAYIVIVPFLFLCTIPLAIFAGVTTTVAFTVLIFRVILVYTDLALALVPSYLSFRTRKRQSPYRALPGKISTTGSPTSKSGSRSPSPVFSSSSRTLSLTRMRRRGSRRPSVAGSIGSATPITADGGIGLAPSVGLDRDFEGVGGWRVGDADDDRWTTINSRLELPDRQHTGRHHHRSPSGDGGLMMKPRIRTRSGSPEMLALAGGRNATSPNSSRVRTPGIAPPALTTMDSRESDYNFPLTPAKGPRKVVV
jgi:hypothetical protein